MSTHFLGIDPGGAFALLDGALDICWVEDSPTDEDELIKLAYAVKIPKEVVVSIERVWAMSRGRKACFKLGGNFWAWKAICYGRGLTKPLTPSPQKWQNHFFKKMDRKLGKKRSVIKCRELYPDSDLFERWEDHNRADAVLIARWAHDFLLGGTDV